jgi:hypothetical protein
MTRFGQLDSLQKHLNIDPDKEKKEEGSGRRLPIQR